MSVLTMSGAAVKSSRKKQRSRNAAVIDNIPNAKKEK
jgi:hypothetical protein